MALWSITLLLATLPACRTLLEPTPTDILSADLALVSVNDVDPARFGLYNALRSTVAPTIIAGDATADMLTFNGTFAQFSELANKQITPANASVSSLWGSIYNTVYIANFMLERLPTLPGLNDARRQTVTAEVRFIRGYAYFIAAYTFGDVPLVLTTNLATNRTVARTPRAQVLAQVLADYQFAANKLTRRPATPAFASDWAVKAALARYYLYQANWPQAERFATEVVDSNRYSLVPFNALLNNKFTAEAILEMGYTVNDDPGTSANGLNNVFVGRRELIPSNQLLTAFFGSGQIAGTRRQSLSFNVANLVGTDNGWSVRKYGPADGNNNLRVFRLGELYLIRAEARAQQGRANGAINSAEADLNALRRRAEADSTTARGREAMLLEVERERVLELAFEGHRWYDLVRTGRATAVLGAFSPNWRATYERWPIPLNDIQNNPALTQNNGY